MVHKVRIFYDDVHSLVDDIGKAMAASTFKPDYMIAIAGGGLIPARLLRNKIKIPILTINLKLYADIGVRKDAVDMLQFLDARTLRKIQEKKILIVDEIHDSGKTAQKAFELFLPYTKQPENIGFAVLHHKNVEKEVKLEETFEQENIFVGKEIGSEWILYPWSEETYEEDVSSGNPPDLMPTSKCKVS